MMANMTVMPDLRTFTDLYIIFQYEADPLEFTSVLMHFLILVPCIYGFLFLSLGHMKPDFGPNAIWSSGYLNFGQTSIYPFISFREVWVSKYETECDLSKAMTA